MKVLKSLRLLAAAGLFALALGAGASKPALASECLLGEVRWFAGNFAPRGWAFAYGQTIPISQNSALFSLLGTMYGGDGRTTFRLPDLRGRHLVGVGATQSGGSLRPGDRRAYRVGSTKGGGKAQYAAPSLALNPIICMVGIYPSRS